MHVRCDNQYKTGADGGNILGQPMLFVCMDICVLSPAQESKMRGYLVYLLIVDLTALSWNLEGYVNHVICRDYICLLYTSPSPRDCIVSRMPSAA